MGQVLQFPIEQQEPKEKSKHKNIEVKKPKTRRKVDDFNAFGHLMFGSAIGFITATNPAGFALVLLGSLLPDIDHCKSTLGKYNPLNRTKMNKHRGHCHSLIGAGLLSLPFFLFGTEAFLLVLYGALGHLVADKVNSWLPRRKKFQLRLW